MMSLTDKAELETLKRQHDIVVAYFTANTCDVGEALLPKVSDLLEASDVKGVVISTYEWPTISGQLLVLVVPTIVLFVCGREFDRMSRHLSLAQVEASIARAKKAVEP